MSSRLRTRLRAGTGLSTPSLNLEFQTAAGTLDPRITFSRTSQATLVDATGKLTYAPNNLLTNSQDFEAATWTKPTGTMTANTAAAPNGTQTADSYSPNVGTINDNIYQSVSGLASGSTYIYSVYLKDTGVGSGWIELTTTNPTTRSWFDIRNGVKGTGAGAIQAVGNGWYRCSVFTTLNNTTSLCYISLRSGDNNAGTIVVASSVPYYYVWGAQLEQVTYQTTPGAYNSTSPKNLLGYTQEFDNAAWTKSNSTAYPFDPVAATRGSELVANQPPYSATTGWTAANSATLAAVSGEIQITAGAAFSLGYTTASVVPGQYYEATVSGRRGTATAAYFSILNDNTGAAIVDGFSNANLAIGSSLTTTKIIFLVPAGCTAIRVAFVHNNQSVGATIFAAAASAKLLSGGLITAPDGSRTADKLVENTANAQHYTSQTASGLVANTPITVSVYLKAAERSIARVINYDGGSNFYGLYINLATGAFISTDAGGSYTNASYSITSAGDGWWRVAVTANIAGTGRLLFVNSAVTGPNATYTGDGTSGIYIWGAQLSNSASLDPYVYNPVTAPTSAAYYGPRFDYDPVTLANKGLLIEEQRTNLLTYSQQFDDASWVKYAGTSITPNATISPDGSSTADLMYPATSGTNRGVYQTFTGGNLTYAQSIYVKSAGKNFVAFYDFEGSTYAGSVDLTTGSTASVKAGYTITPTQAGSGWWRITVTATTTTGTRYLTLIVVDAAGSASVTANGTSGVYIWGAQVEAGSFATSYIPTVASQVTRTADVALMQGANFSNWYNQNEGTLLVEGSTFALGAAGTSRGFAGLSNGAFSESSAIYNLGSSNLIKAEMIDDSVPQAAFTATIASQPFKVAYAYAPNNSNMALNGTAQTTDTVCTIPTVNRLVIGSVWAAGDYPTNGHIRRIGYYPTRLANEQLQSLTAQSTIPSLSLDFTTQVFNVG